MSFEGGDLVPSFLITLVASEAPDVAATLLAIRARLVVLLLLAVWLLLPLVDPMPRSDDSNVYGHSLDDSMFGILDDTVAVSSGDWPRTNPTETGGGVWEGVLAGVNTWTRDRIEGGALIGIDDLSRPKVDVPSSASKMCAAARPGRRSRRRAGTSG